MEIGTTPDGETPAGGPGSGAAGDRAGFVADLGRADSGWPRLLGAWSVLAAKLPEPVRGPAARRLDLVDGWRFTGDVPAGWAAPDLDDGSWEAVVVPHCAVPLSWREWDPASWEREFCYRRSFVAPATFAGLRVLLDFAAVATKATVVLNGVPLGVHLGGYLPFRFEVTDVLVEGRNSLAVLVDGSFALNVPPNSPTGTNTDVDYCQPAGIYREVVLRGVPQLFVDDVFAKPVDVLSDSRHVEVEVTVDRAVATSGSGILTVEILDPAGRPVGSAAAPVAAGASGVSVHRLDVTDLAPVTLWDVDRPALHDVVTTLVWNGEALHEHRSRIGFREARFSRDGFLLNGRRRTIMGLNRHQHFPFAGFATGDRVQRRDAELIRGELNATMVRCSHYPPSPAFLDACDELGLMVWEEPPGWQYLGDADWRELLCRDVAEMVRRDRNRPSVVLWAPRPNEVADDTALWTRTQAIVRALDDSRQTAAATHGDGYFTTDYQQDVFGYDDYTVAHDGTDHVPHLLPPRTDLPYLVSESITWRSSPTQLYRRTDTAHVQRHQALAHAVAHEKVARDPRYCGLLAWSAIDYQSAIRTAFGGVKYSGVLDTFRVPKPGAAIYRAQVDPRVRPVIEPAFFFGVPASSSLAVAASGSFGGEAPGGPGADAMVCSNCDRLEIYLDGRHRATVLPDRARFGGLAHPPSFVDLSLTGGLPELRIDGYLGDRRVLSRSFAADPAGDRLQARADDGELLADGVDATRVVVAAVDRFGNLRPFATGEVTFDLSGPAVLVGESPFAFGAAGGVGAVWLRTVRGRPGTVRLRAHHDGLGEAAVIVEVRPG